MTNYLGLSINRFLLRNLTLCYIVFDIKVEPINGLE